mmetsp:Transcript_12552/g.21229  ORF Transcript_12552/g.21229 Transcript_12552/m.21229 type:complete len:302 (-) Transcript_12552:140-1045(-)
MKINVLVFAVSFLVQSCLGLQPLQTRSLRRVAPIMSSTIGRKESFWREVAFGLAEQFSLKEVKRVIQFGEYARGELPAPIWGAKAPGHEPCEEYIDGLEAKPWHDPTEFSWIAGLEANAAVIQAELAAVLAEDSQSFNADSALQTQVMGSGWSALRLQRLGRWNEANMARFPKTTALLAELNVPTAMRGVMFARQAPGSRVGKHSDGRNFVLTAHLGLQVPLPEAGECWMEVGGERQRWEEGKCVVIDTSFSHETCNLGPHSRHVLILDFWHPGLSEAEQKALKFVYDLRYKYDSELINAS